jgi:hypothetical protein
MGKGKHDRNPSNKSRRRRKARIKSFVEHLTKHPNYWNENNIIPFKTWQLIFIFYALILACYDEK